MTFTVNTLMRCPGGEHYALNITIASGPTGTIRSTKADMDFDPRADLEATRQEIIDRCRSALKEAGANTWLLARLTLEGMTFKL